MSDHELRIRIEPGDGGAFRVFASAPAGEVKGTFELPFDERDVELFVLRVSRGGKGRRRVEPSEIRQVQEFGGTLFDSLFRDRVGELYRVARNMAEREQSRLRVTLSLTAVPELMHLPWEYLYDRPDFLAISKWTPVVRYLELQSGQRPLDLRLPLRILAMVSNPEETAELDVAQERENLERALAGLVERGAVEITWLENATLRTLLRTLETGPFHVFHYIGHGAYDAEIEDGVLLLEDERGRPRRVTGRELGTILADHRTLRLAVLNACEGARTSSTDPFAGVAASLVERKIPAVIAMQFEITDRAAIIFAGEFYWKLADSGTVDTALAFARQAIYADDNKVEWATPVLFMRVPDGRVFEVPEAPLPRPAPAVATEPPVEPPGVPPGPPGPPVPPPTPTQPGRRRRPATVVAAIGALAAIAALAAGVVVFAGGDDAPDAGPPPENAATATVPTTPPPEPTDPASERWTLLGAIPEDLRPTCGGNGEDLWVPAGLLAEHANASFLSGFKCGSESAVVAQYSRAASRRDLENYFHHRANSASLPALAPTPAVCGAGDGERAHNHWRPVGAAGHEPIATNQGFGRVICYEKDGKARIEWTDNRSRVYGAAEGPDRNALFRWWTTAAGPTAPQD